MRQTRFIFIEGIIGAGKSTTAWFLTEHLRRQQIEATFMPEGYTPGSPPHPLRVASDLPHPFAVWQDVSPQGFIALSLQKWQRFVQANESARTVTVCDGLLFHGNMTDLLLIDTPAAELQSYVQQVISILQPLAPMLIYLRHDDVTQALAAVVAARGVSWQQYQVDWKVRSPYAERRSLAGFAGLVQIYHDYRALCDEIFATLAMPKLAISRDGDWAAHEAEILAFLQKAEV